MEGLLIVAGLVGAAAGWLAIALVRDWWSNFTRRHGARLRAVPLAVALLVAAGVLLDQWTRTNPEQVVVVAGAVSAGSVVVAVVGVVLIWRRELTAPAGTPVAPDGWVHDPHAASGVYFLQAYRREAPGVLNHWKVGCSGDIENRIGQHRTVSGDPLLVHGRIGVVGKDEYEALERQVKDDLLPWRLRDRYPSIAAVETYEPDPRVEAYIDDLLGRAGA